MKICHPSHKNNFIPKSPNVENIGCRQRGEQKQYLRKKADIHIIYSNLNQTFWNHKNIVNICEEKDIPYIKGIRNM